LAVELAQAVLLGDAHIREPVLKRDELAVLGPLLTHKLRLRLRLRLRRQLRLWLCAWPASLADDGPLQPHEAAAGTAHAPAHAVGLPLGRRARRDLVEVCHDALVRAYTRAVLSFFTHQISPIGSSYNHRALRDE
jgi:hypothetical protein